MIPFPRFLLGWSKLHRHAVRLRFDWVGDGPHPRRELMRDSQVNSDPSPFGITSLGQRSRPHRRAGGLAPEVRH